MRKRDHIKFQASIKHLYSACTKKEKYSYGPPQENPRVHARWTCSTNSRHESLLTIPIGILHRVKPVDQASFVLLRLLLSHGPSKTSPLLVTRRLGRRATCPQALALILSVGTRWAAISLGMHMVLTAESAALALELVHGHGGQGGGAVVAGRFVVDFMDRDGGVHDLGLNGFLLDDGLDCFVDVAGQRVKRQHFGGEEWKGCNGQGEMGKEGTY